MRKFGWSRYQSSPRVTASIRASLRVSYNVIMEHRDLILRGWHEHFGDGSSI